MYSGRMVSIDTVRKIKSEGSYQEVILTLKDEG